MKAFLYSSCKRLCESVVKQTTRPNMKIDTKHKKITDFLKCPISGNHLKIDEETGGLYADYIFYKKEKGIYLLIEEKSEIRL